MNRHLKEEELLLSLAMDEDENSKPILEMGDVGFNDYITTYAKDYAKKQISRTRMCGFKSEYNDILSGPYTEYVLPSFKMIGDHEQYEDPKHCVNRLREKYPELEGILDKELDEDKISSEYKNKGKTVYQVEICKPEDVFVSKKTLARERVTLPSDWKDPPATVQRASYRDFKSLFNWKVVPKPVKLPVESLRPNYKEREILKIKTGDSEYNSKIGKVGTEIIRDKLHGVIEDPDYCEGWKIIELNRTGQPYRVSPPYPVLYW